ncbi:hypothetical protein DLAC_08868 [Tieghemostelium lacteum]|uniref:Transmembrane protein n=1 Tax=Tieghemostelium lacteum TaxID=361077 RepID=A0A151Z8J9_TIELA|nr:hypothetical protein DLAC_08868 [Tieghemostelium lacteum]|eukprot:KYQ90265.1 hypothetical protein DLAC_08868 [Tieghemostelium lacteum]
MAKHTSAIVKCCFIFAILCFVCLTLGGFILLFETLLPSINKAKAYVETDCLVTQSFDTYQCDSNAGSCVSYNDDIFWYQSYGPSYYFIYVSGGYPSNNSYGSDDDNDDDDDGGNDTGEDDDDDGDDTGDTGGGDDDDDGGGDDGDYVSDIVSSPTTNGQYTLDGVKSYRNQLKRQLKAMEQQDSFSSASSLCDYSICYQGEQYVTFTDQGGVSRNATVEGLWSSDLAWVQSYTTKYAVNSSYQCYYNTNDESLVMWFKPPAYDKSAMTGVIILFILAFVSLITSIIFAVKFRHEFFPSHHHPHTKHHGVNYTVVQQQPPQSYQPQPYYQYTNGVPSAPNF